MTNQREFPSYRVHTPWCMKHGTGLSSLTRNIIAHLSIISLQLSTHPFTAICSFYYYALASMRLTLVLNCIFLHEKLLKCDAVTPHTRISYYRPPHRTVSSSSPSLFQPASRHEFVCRATSLRRLRATPRYRYISHPSIGGP